MKNVLNRDNLSFTFVQWFLWSGFAVLFGFQVPYLKQSGYDEIGIGALMSLMALVSIAGPIIWGIVSDHLRTCRWILAANLAAGGASVLLTPFVVKDSVLLAATMIFGNLTVCSMPAIVDAWAMRLKSRGAPINYGVIRSAGSLAYAVTNIACGLLLTRFGLGLMFPLFCGFGFATAAVVLLIREEPVGIRTEACKSEKAVGQGVSPLSLLGNSAFMIFVVLATLLYVGLSAEMNFYPLLLQNAGGSNADLGLALGIMALSEFPVMFLSALLLKRFKDTTLLLVAMGFFAVRIFLFYMLQSTAGLVWSQMTNSLSFGLFMPASVHFIIRVTPAKLKGTALTVASSAYMGIGGIVGNALGGIISDGVGLRPMFGMAAALAAAVAAAFGLVLFFTRKKGIFSDPLKMTV